MKTEKPNETAVIAWAKLVRAFTQLHGTIEQELKLDQLPPLAWYDVLLELHREQDGGLRQFEIARQTLLPKYNLSRLLDKLESEKLVRRRVCAEDGRGNRVLITEKGVALLKRMWSVYGAAIYHRLESKLEPDEVTTLTKILDKLIE